MSQEKSKWHGFLFLFAILIAGWTLRAIEQQIFIGKEMLLPSKRGVQAGNSWKWMDEAGENLMPEMDSMRIFPAHSSASFHNRQDVQQLHHTKASHINWVPNRGHKK